MKKCFALLLAVSLWAPVGGMTEADPGIFVRKLAGLPDAFLLGCDISSLQAEEKSGVVYRDAEGKPRDALETLKEAGVTCVRIRVWVDPFDSLGNSYGGNDLATAVALGKRAAELGLRSIIDFHYSDFWADPGKQQAPKAWEGLGVGAKAEALYAYTKKALETLIAAGVDVMMIQLGDVTNSANAVLNLNNLAALFLSNEGTVNGLLAATADGSELADGGRFGDLIVAGFDAGASQKNAIRQGWFVGSVTQDPYRIGYLAVELGFKAASGEAVADVDTGAQWYTSENIDLPEIALLVYD